MLKIVDAVEVEVVGVFKDPISASFFNKQVGEHLRLYPLRTTLSIEQFTKEIFRPGNDGAFLEQCVGKGNVHIRITKDTFKAAFVVSGKYTDREQLIKQADSFGKRNTNGILKTTHLLTKQEIKKLAKNPSKFVMNPTFGILDERNINDFLSIFDECSKNSEEVEYVHSFIS